MSSYYNSQNKYLMSTFNFSCRPATVLRLVNYLEEPLQPLHAEKIYILGDIIFCIYIYLLILWNSQWLLVKSTVFKNKRHKTL